jgi:hypothetical protein
VTAERKCERDAMDRGKVVPERRDGIKHRFHALTLSMRCTIAYDPESSRRCHQRGSREHNDITGLDVGSAYSSSADRRVDDRLRAADHVQTWMTEVVAEELSKLAERARPRQRVAEVERVNARLEEAALTTARSREVSRHWDAVYDMRRADAIDREISSERDHDAARTRRGESSD